ncbi:MAG: hypothetical protein HKO96_10530 [Flavobacteriaceae bacterium]|nr:hypothetical protein [Flavobacteriaceae bacterium]
MTGNIRFKVLPNIKLTLVYYEGNITLAVLFEHLTRLGSHESYNAEFNTISDFGTCVFEVNNKIIKEAADFVKKDTRTLGKRKNALLFRDPKQQVITSLFSMVVGEILINYNIVPNFRKATEFIELKQKHFKIAKAALITLSGKKGKQVEI